MRGRVSIASKTTTAKSTECYNQAMPDSSAGQSAAFEKLMATITACRACPAMEGRRRVFSELNGRTDARVLFIAEAPGRFGAEVTGVPLSNDQSGRNFERLLAESGLRRAEIFITNAVLCNPRDPDGRNRPPKRTELMNCASHLRAQLLLIVAPVVVTLGATALRSIESVQPHGLALAASVAQPVAWNGRVLFPLYHPSPQAFMSRGVSRQIEDYRALGRLVRDLG